MWIGGLSDGLPRKQPVRKDAARNRIAKEAIFTLANLKIVSINRRFTPPRPLLGAGFWTILFPNSVWEHTCLLKLQFPGMRPEGRDKSNAVPKPEFENKRKRNTQ
jgi:hypothetical protein